MSETKVVAVNDKVVGKIIKAETTTKSGIILSEQTAQEPQCRCVVMSIGKDVTDEIKVGDTIYCHNNGGMDILVNKEPWKVLKNDEIYAIINS